MALFHRANPEAALTAKVDTKRVERDKKARLLAEDQRAVAGADAEATRLADDGADSIVINAVGGKQGLLKFGAEKRKDALAKVDAELAELEAELQNVRDDKQRGETKAKLYSKAARLKTLKPQFDALFAEMVAITADDTPSAEGWDGFCLAKYAKDSASQIPAAIDLVVRSYHVTADRVLSGQLPAKLTEPPAPRPVAVAIEELRTTRLIAVKNVCWTDTNGQLKSAGKRNTIDVPPATAVRALTAGHCQEIGSEFWKAWGNSTALSTPPISECTSIDGTESITVTAVIPSSDPQFTPYDRGPAITMQIAKEAS